MAKVYLLAVGEYSDYRIEAAFSDKTAAERHAEYRNSDGPVYGPEYRIEELEIRESAPAERTVYTIAAADPKVQGFPGLAIVRDGELENGIYVMRQSQTYWDYEDRVVGLPQNGRPWGKWLGKMVYRVAGLDPDAVEKAHQDRFYQLKARMEGIA